MNIGIIGMGVVGLTTAKVLAKKHEIHSYDKYKKEYNDIQGLINSEVVFICVPTPMKKSGEIDYSSIYDSLNFLLELTRKNKKYPLVVIRSTTVSGTTDKLAEQYPELKFVFNPEFLTQRTALTDMENTSRVVIGANDKESAEKVVEIYKPLFPDAKYIIVDRKTAEMIKYAANTFLASQVGIANEIYNICRAIGVDYNKVKEAVLLDNLIGKNINVPGPDGDFGFGGKCLGSNEYILTKDNNNIIDLIKIPDIWEKKDVKVLGLNSEWINVDLVGETLDDILEIGLSKGLILHCNPSHIFTLFDNGGLKDMRANDIKIGNEVPVCFEKLPEENIFFDLRDCLSVNKKFDVLLQKKTIFTRKERHLLHTYTYKLKSKKIKYEKYLLLNKPPNRDKITTRYNSKSFMSIIFKLNNDLARLIGYYLSEGNLTNDRVYWSFGKHERNLIKDVTHILKSKGIKPIICKKKSTYIIHTSFTPFVYFWKSLNMGNDAYSKKIPSVIFKAKKDAKFNLLKGYFRGDGNAYFTKEGYITISCSSVSRDLIEGIMLLLRDRNILPSFKISQGKKMKIEGRTVNSKEYYTLNINEANAVDDLCKLFPPYTKDKIIKFRKKYKIINSSAYSKYPNFYTLKIKSIKNVGKGYVYGLSLKEAPRFITTGGILTHNCLPKDLNALIYLAREQMYRPYLLEEVWRLNEKVRQNKDWLSIDGATSENNPDKKEKQKEKTSK